MQRLWHCHPLLGFRVRRHNERQSKQVVFCLSLGLLVGSVSDSGGFAPYLELMGFYISQLLQLLTDVLL